MSDHPQDPTMLLKRLANFRPDRFGAMAAAQKWRKERKNANPRAAPEHLTLIRQLPCIVCGVKTEIHAHHLRSSGLGQTRGIGQKVADRHTVPLCWKDHDAVHRIGSKLERAWFIAESGIDAYVLADALWSTSGDTSRMYRVILAHQLAASRDLLERSKK